MELLPAGVERAAVDTPAHLAEPTTTVTLEDMRLGVQRRLGQVAAEVESSRGKFANLNHFDLE